MIDRLERLADRLEATLELAVRAGPADVVEHGQQVGENAGQRDLLRGHAVTVDPTPVVGVLGLQPLEISSALGQLGGQPSSR